MAKMKGNIKKGASEKAEDKNLTKLAAKEILDKIGFGFSSQQFINILFLQTGASIFLIGLINILRVIFGNLTSFFIEKHQNLKTNKRLIGISGIVFGFSFLMIATSIFLKSTALFALAVIIGCIAIAIYSEANAFFGIRGGKAYMVEKIVKYSLVMTAISLFTAAYLMDKYPISGKPIFLNMHNNIISLNLYGYLIVFEIAAISFIVAGYILSKSSKEPATNSSATNLQLRSLFNFFVENKIFLFLVAASIIISLVQTIGYSYYGIFIYQNFNSVLFGGFLNVAMVFLISVFTSLIGYFITKINIKAYRKLPILILGIIMAAFMPFAYYLKQDLIFLTMGTIIGVIGITIVGVTNSFLTIGLINFDLRQSYFSLINLASIPFFLVISPVLAYIAQAYGLSILFLVLTTILLVLVIALLAASAIFKNIQV